MRPICRSILVQVIVPANTARSAQIAFPDVKELREQGTKVYGVESVAQAQLSIGTGLIDVVSAADADNIVFTLVERSTQRIQQVPFLSFNIVTTAGIYREVSAFQPDMQRSTIQFTATPAATTFVVPFLFHYAYMIDPIYERL